MKRKIKILIMVVLCISCILPAVTFGAEIPIGAFFPMTGPIAHYGRIFSRGALTAIDHINSEGGIEGNKFKLVITDHKNIEANLAVTGVRKMISIDKIPIVLCAQSVTTLAVQPICAKANVVMLNGGAYSPKLVNLPYLHTIRLSQGQLVPGMLSAYWKMGIRRLAVVYMSDPSGVIPAEEITKPMWTKWGGAIAGMEPHQPGVTNFSAYLARIKAGKPDAIIAFTTGDDMAYLIKGAREMGLNCPIAIPDWGPDFQTITGNTSDNVFVFSDSFNRNSANPMTQRFVKDHEAKWGEQTEFFSANYYDAVYNITAELVRRVVKKGGDPMNGAALEEAIWMNPTFKTVYDGDLILKKDGTVDKPMVIFKITNGKMNAFESITGKDTKK